MPSDYYRAHLHEHLDARGDLAPPWEAFPTYERYTIGWRMGAGEGHMSFWWCFLEGLGPDQGARLAYLKRHAPAPLSWSDCVWAVLHPGAEPDPDAYEAQRAWLRAEGLVAPDVAWATWRTQQRELTWPWAWSKSPVHAARYGTRDLWFWSRHVAELRAAGTLPDVDAPEAWSAVAEAARRGEATVDPARGLHSLACALAAGEVPAPWRVGLRPEDFRDSFEHDMGYVDAYRLWVMCAFDDEDTLARHLALAPPPEPWVPWVRAQLALA